MDLKSVKETIKTARRAVEDEEEPYRTEAFKLVLARLLHSDELNLRNTERTEPQQGRTKNKNVKETAINDVEIDETLLNKIDIDKLPFVNLLKSVHDKCLALLNYVSDNLPEYSGLTTEEMKKIFADKFGLTTITTNNISMSLKHVTGRYVTRRKITGKIQKYRYQILHLGNEYIKKQIIKIQEQSGRRMK